MFLQTTFPPSDRLFHGMLDRLIAKEGGLFRGPYLSVKLPFRQGKVARTGGNSTTTALLKFLAAAARALLIASGRGCGVANGCC